MFADLFAVHPPSRSPACRAQVALAALVACWVLLPWFTLSYGRLLHELLAPGHEVRIAADIHGQSLQSLSCPRGPRLTDAHGVSPPPAFVCFLLRQASFAKDWAVGMAMDNVGQSWVRSLRTKARAQGSRQDTRRGSRLWLVTSSYRRRVWVLFS